MAFAAVYAVNTSASACRNDGRFDSSFLNGNLEGAGHLHVLLDQAFELLLQVALDRVDFVLAYDALSAQQASLRPYCPRSVLVHGCRHHPI